MIVIKNVFGGSRVVIKNVFANAENIVVVYNGGEPISITGGGGGVSDHGALTGLADDDHTQYLNNARGDLRYEPLKGADDNFVTDAEKTKLANLSGTNTGDQDLSGKQDVLVSGTSIKTVNGTSLLGSGDLVVGQTIYNTDLELLNALGANIKAQTHDVKLISAATLHTLFDRQLDITAIYLPVAATLTGVKWIQHTAGNYTGDQYNGWGLYSYSGGTLTLVASTTSDTEIWKGTALTTQTKAFGSTYAASAGVYYIAALYNQSAQTTAPIIKAKLSIGTGPATLLTNSAKICGYTLANNALPASIASSGITDNPIQPWVALY